MFNLKGERGEIDMDELGKAIAALKAETSIPGLGGTEDPEKEVEQREATEVEAGAPHNKDKVLLLKKAFAKLALQKNLKD